MQCENVYCIYCEKMECKLEEISLDVQGQCTECIYVEIEEELIAERKQKQLKLIGFLEI